MTDYISHRTRVRERIEAGEVALSIAEPADREAYWSYYADYLSGKELADAMDLAAGFSEFDTAEGSALFWGLGVALVLIAIVIGGLFWLWDSVDIYIAWLTVWWPIIVLGDRGA